ncbi:hypothetical protein JYU34_000737 [Plutella xylostella]|uniref:Uncharacterized protein n=1 Tax=Plutella xylostella TaxID=51655 RepID=A0ABQ7R8F3_PLUXY|nr:hypothetical protein JYU34_000737 [Plutella xylostella]
MHRLRAEPPAPANALAAEMFDHLCAAGTMKQILALHREICNTLNLKPNRLPDFYPILKAKLSCSWKAQALFKKFDARANHKVYAKGRACAGTRVLIIGAGPCGLRAAIECQLLGAKVVVVEKRDRMSRNNVLHLWPFVIQDLRALGAKKFLGKFCAGSIDHISIRQLQCILMKVSLLLGVEIHEGVSFEELLEPTVTENNETLGWRARVLPADHPVSQYQFDTLVGADGRRNTLAGFKRKEFRGKLAMAITANFINRHSEQEASVPEISGVAFIFNQKFFKDLYEETGIDLENIVYYKDDTHYFVMTAKKHSLLDKGVLLKDFSDVSRLLDVDNVDRAALMRYAQEAARFSTDGRLPLKDFALNHYGEPDVALFDFTSMYAAENASLVIERHNHRILCQLVGDSLLEPFWPTGSGCARGFLSALDAAWAVRAWGQSPQPHPLHVIAERESIYRLLAQTTPENLNRDFGGYTLEPGTRYRNLNRGAVTPHRVAGFYDSDEPQPLDAPDKPRKRRREAEVPDEVLLTWVGAPSLRQAAASGALSALLRRYRPDLLPPGSQQPLVYHALQHNFGIAPLSSTGSLREPSEAKVRAYLTRIYHALKGEVPHVHHETEHVFDQYLTRIYHALKGEVPHVHHQTEHVFDQMKQNIQKEKHARTAPDQSLYMYATAVESDKSHSSYRKKRRGQRAPQVSNETEEYIRKKIGKLHLDEISQLARLIDGHDAVVDLHAHKEKQKTLQNEILALLDEDEAPSPKMIRETLAQLLNEPTTPKITQPKPKAIQPEQKPRTKRHVEETKPQDLQKFFAETSTEQKPVKQQRKLKGLDLSSMNFPDLSDILDDIDVEPAVKPQRKLKGLDFDSMRFPDLSNLLDDVDLDTAVVPSPDISKKKEFNRSVSTECRIAPPVMKVPFGRSNSIGAPESVAGARRVAEIYESSKRRHSQSPKPKSVLGASTFERALKWQGMSEVQGRTRIPVPRMKRDSFGNLDMGVRRQKVSELIQGAKPQRSTSPDYVPRRRNSGEVAFKVQRHSDMMQKHKTNDKKKSGGRRKAAREIMKQRFDKSLQMLAAEPRLDFASSADLENDYGLQQYRASAPHFDERVKKLEKQLQHYVRILGVELCCCMVVSS